MSLINTLQCPSSDSGAGIEAYRRPYVGDCGRNCTGKHTDRDQWQSVVNGKVNILRLNVYT